MKDSGDFIFIICLLLIYLSQVEDAKMINDLNRLNDIKTKPKSRDKCEIEILTRGSCLVNNNRLKPRIILHLKSKPHKTPAETIRQSTQKPVKKKNQFDDNDLEYKKQIIFEFVFRVLRLMKIEYGDQMRPLIIDVVQNIQLKTYGTADIYDLKINGLNNIEPSEVSFEDSLESSIWVFNVTFYISNITADFKVDINVNEKIFVKNWNLGIHIEQCSFKSGFILDFDKQSLFLNAFHIKSFGNFRMISESFSWPFNEIISNIVSQEKYFIKDIIESYSQKYINMTLNNNFDLNSILQRILDEN